MKNRLSSYVLWLSCLLIASANTALPAEFFVNADGTGDFTTISQAVAVMQPGDICTVGPGTYNERVRMPVRISGTASKKTIFRAIPPRQATMQGFDTQRTNYVRIEGFQITHSYTGGMDGVGIMIRSNYVEIINNYIYNVRGSGVCGYWNEPKSENVWVSGNYIYRGQSGINISGKNWLVENNKVERLYRHADYDCDYTRFFGENIVIRNNEFFGTIQSEIGKSHVDGFQTFDNNGEYARNVSIYGNRISDCHQGMMAEAHHYNNSSDFLIYNNIFRNCWSWALDIHGVRNVQVFHNVFADMKVNGVGLRSAASGRVINNIFYNAGSIYWAEDDCTMEGRNNLVYRVGATIDSRKYVNDIVNSSPKFVNASGGDYRLLSGSPAIDSGSFVGITYDIDNKQRPSGASVEIGPFEHYPRAAARSWASYQ